MSRTVVIEATRLCSHSPVATAPHEMGAERLRGRSGRRERVADRASRGPTLEYAAMRTTRACCRIWGRQQLDGASNKRRRVQK